MQQERTSQYDPVFERISRTARDSLAAYFREAEPARHLMASLLAECPSARAEVVSNPRFHSLPLVNLLLSRSSDLWATEPSSAIDAASLATRIADQLESARLGMATVEEAVPGRGRISGTVGAFLGSFLRPQNLFGLPRSTWSPLEEIPSSKRRRSVSLRLYATPKAGPPQPCLLSMVPAQSIARLVTGSAKVAASLPRGSFSEAPVLTAERFLAHARAYRIGAWRTIRAWFSVLSTIRSTSSPLRGARGEPASSSPRNGACTVATVIGGCC
jgi:hypothetical protein